MVTRVVPTGKACPEIKSDVVVKVALQLSDVTGVPKGTFAVQVAVFAFVVILAGHWIVGDMVSCTVRI